MTPNSTNGPRSFAFAFLAAPSRAAAQSAEPSSLKTSFWIYGLSVVCTALTLKFRPSDFPDALNTPVYSMFAWVGFIVWHPILMAVMIATCAILLRWFNHGRLVFKMLSACIWSVLPLLLLVWREQYVISLAASALFFIIWASPAIVIARMVPLNEWRKLTAFLCGLSIIEIVTLLPETLAILARWEAGFRAVLAGAGLWMLLSGARGLKSMNPNRSLARALIPYILSLVVQLEILALAHRLLGFIPKDTFRMLLYG